MNYYVRRLAGFSVALFSLAALQPLPASAADEKGDFAVRGLGASQCSSFVEAAQGNQSSVGLFLAWIEGAVTAVNHVSPKTFDVVPFNSTAPFAAIVLDLCRQHPAASFDTAVRSAISFVEPLRISTNSPFVEMSVGRAKVTLRQYTLARVQQRLRELKLTRSPPSGKFDAETRDAIKRFQQARKLTVTELPDPDTVLALLLQK